jgi:hypothetical protein
VGGTTVGKVDGEVAYGLVELTANGAEVGTAVGVSCG